MKIALALATWAAPALAIACPACARDATRGTVLLVAAMIAAPYAIAWAVLRVVRGGGR